jgi:sarcosine oxidase subunit alpha
MKKCDILIIGGGPAGLEAAYYANKYAPNLKIILVEENFLLGGQLIKQTHSFFGSKEQYAGTRGFEISNLLTERVSNQNNIEIMLQTSAIGYYKPGIVACEDSNHKLLEIEAKKIIVAAGARENMALFPGNDLPGVFGAGAAQTLMNVYGVLPGKRVLMLGAGNIGLIVSYQLMQAGAEVLGIVEGLPTIGGYHVHAAKVRRMGIPIFTSHTVVRANGDDCLEEVEIAPIDNKWQICGDIKKFSADTLCLSVGLTPGIELLQQAECRIEFVRELGGFVAWHDRYLETSNPNILIAGDISGIEEASTAMIEGKIAALNAVSKLTNSDLSEDIENALSSLNNLRMGPHGERARRGKEILINMSGGQNV